MQTSYDTASNTALEASLDIALTSANDATKAFITSQKDAVLLDINQIVAKRTGSQDAVFDFQKERVL